MSESIEIPYLERKRQLNKKRNREIFISAAKDTFQQVLTQYNLTTNEAVSEFRKYTGEDSYYASVMFNTFYSFYLQ